MLMKSSRYYLLPALVAATLVPSAWAQKEVTVRRLDKDGPNHAITIHGSAEMEKEKVTFLGVETAPVNRTLAAQLGLNRDTGLVVTRISDQSPAAAVLKEDDVLTRLDDQILVNQQQLGVLVRAKKDRPWDNPREARILIERGVLSIVGGKYTTARHLAERVVDAVVKQIGVKAGKCDASKIPTLRKRTSG